MEKTSNNSIASYYVDSAYNGENLIIWVNVETTVLFM